MGARDRRFSLSTGASCKFSKEIKRSQESMRGLFQASWGKNHAHLSGGQVIFRPSLWSENGNIRSLEFGDMRIYKYFHLKGQTQV